jgi:hypothetical protein
VSNPEDASKVVEAYSKSPAFLELTNTSTEPTKNGDVPVTHVSRRPEAAPMWLQFSVISARFFRSMMRHPIAFVAELTQYWFMALFVGESRKNEVNTVNTPHFHMCRGFS